MSRWPSVGVVIPTHDRPGPLRAALDAVLGQDYPGQLRVIVVYDRAEPVLKPNDSMAVLVNDRTPGLAGARNTGIVKLDIDLVAFCDDDVWQPGKLRKQVWALRARPGTEFAGCGIEVDYEGTVHPRLAGRDEVTHADLLRSRMVMGGDAAALAVFRAIARQPYFNPAGGG